LISQSGFQIEDDQQINFFSKMEVALLFKF